MRPLIRIAALLCLCSAAHAQPSLQILDYGAEPRAPLRYVFTAGQSERVTMEMAMAMSQEVNGQMVPVAQLPPVRSTMNVRVTDVAPDGSARLEFETRSAEADMTQAGGPGDQARLGETLAMQSQMKGWYRTDTRGRTLETGISMPDGAMPAAASQMMDDLLGNQNETVQQLPEEAVGIGARWRVEQRISAAGVEEVQTEEYTLTSRSGSRIELLAHMTQGLASLPPAAVAEGITGSSSATGSGKLTIDLHKLTPTMTMEVNSGTAMSTPTQQGQPKTMKMNMQMKMSIAPAAD
jgi:hypothetical protein